MQSRLIIGFFLAVVVVVVLLVVAVFSLLFLLPFLSGAILMVYNSK